MAAYKKLSKQQLIEEKNRLIKEYEEFKSLGRKLDMSRGKPSVEQLKLSLDMMNCLTDDEIVANANYGLLDGNPSAKSFFAEIMEVSPKQVIVGGNTSLNMMFDAVSLGMHFGFSGNPPWSKQEKVKFLCPVPGYDRHFAITELMNIEMINIPMNENGPDMDMVEDIVQNDSQVKGIWCVPKYSNPTGITYSDETVCRFAALKPAAPDFRIFWDNAYIVHHLSDEPKKLLNILSECEKNNNQDIVFEFVSTSKITFAGGGVGALASGEKNVKEYLKVMAVRTIGYDKINQFRHSKYFSNQEKLKEHMRKHAEMIKPKFDTVINKLNDELAPLEIASWTEPKGGYFISFDTIPGCAKRVYELCKEAGVTLTGVGATFPYGIDPEDSNIRIAPTFPTLTELEQAMKLFCTSVKIASIEKLIR